MIIIAKHGQAVQIDDADVALLGGQPLHIDSVGYPCVSRRDGRRHSMRLQVLLCGKQPWGSCVDHINGDRLDNRRCNLRVTGHHVNGVNRKKLNRNNKSGIRGVFLMSPRKSRRRFGLASRVAPRATWVARIEVHYKPITVGYFATREEATKARHAAELKYFGVLCPTSEVSL